MKFYKYHGAGNDFILIDNRQHVFKGDKIQFAIDICKRRFGVGSDGLIFIENDDTADFLMDFLNPDGSRSFCGNGSRCAVKFAHFIEIFTQQQVTFKAIDGIHKAELIDNLVKIEMKNVSTTQQLGNDYFIHTGSPHYIKYYNSIDDLNIINFGKKIRYSDTYKKEGTNVNAVEIINNNHLKIRTYERGVENETLACGTGVTACALSYAKLKKLTNNTVNVDAVGGKLSVSFKQQADGSFTDIWLIGPAEFVFSGSYDL
ncbi:MAG TPA: diaminopimelate epimerase [Crocinitomix sp.]|nr:diaminopimelate epimerase [Crocinitomix sp.]